MYKRQPYIKFKLKTTVKLDKMVDLVVADQRDKTYTAENGGKKMCIRDSRYTDETHGEGYLRAFFNKVKAGTYSSIERCFIHRYGAYTGTNYSLTPQFNQMMGFTEEEVREMLTYYSTNSPFRHTCLLYTSRCV